MGKQIDHLVQMANQIALNVSSRGDVDAIAASIGEHLVKFWTPAMRQQLLGYHREGGGELSPAVEVALQRIA